MSDKPIPHSPDAEMGVLGLIMRDIRVFHEANTLSVDHFYTRSNKLIFSTILSLMGNGTKVDAITLTEDLKSRGNLEEVGGAYYLSKLGISYASINEVDHLVKILDEKMNLRRIIELGNRIQEEAYSETESSSILESMGGSIIKFQGDQSSGNMLSQTADNVLGMIERRQRGEKLIGLKTSIHVIDNVLGGLNPRFYVIAARGGRGKTAIMEQMVDAILLQNEPVLVFQKDMSLEMFLLRIACRRAAISFSKFDLGHTNQFENSQIKDHVVILKDSPLHLYSPANLTAAKLLSIVKLECRIHDIKAVFLDHILNLDVGSDYRVGLTRASSAIRESVQNNNIPHVILAQLNRGAHNTERPTPAHIKEFDALYADCDAMMMLWSEKEPNEVPRNEIFPMKLLVNKNRYGSEFEEDIGFDRQLIKFIPMRKI